MKKAFTTIEVILIILLLAVWLGVALPRFGAGDILNKYRLKAAAYEANSEIKYTRSLAIANARTYIIKFDFVQKQYRIYRDSIAAENQVGETKTIPAQITCSGTDQFDFTSLGEASWPAGTGETNFSIPSGSQYRITATPATGTTYLQKIS